MGDFRMSKTLLDVLGKRLTEGASEAFEKAQEIFQEVFVVDPSEDRIADAEEISHHLDMNWCFVATCPPITGWQCVIEGTEILCHADTPEEALEDARIELALMLTRQQKKGKSLSEPPTRPTSGRY